MIFAPTTGLENRAPFSGAVNPSRTPGGGGSFFTRREQVFPACQDENLSHTPPIEGA